MRGLSDTADLELAMEGIEHPLEFAQGRQISEVSVLVHVHADEVSDFDGARTFRILTERSPVALSGLTVRAKQTLDELLAAFYAHTDDVAGGI